MEFPTNVFENGQWVTRMRDAFTIASRNRQPEFVPPQARLEAPKAPTLGVMTRTVIRSPAVKWIIPARIRHYSKNDVLYITSDRVEIKEISPDITLKHIAVKDDFDSPIRVARICGRERRPTGGNIDTIIPGPGEKEADDEEMAYVKPEPDDNIDILDENQLDDEDRHSLRTVPLRQRRLGPHTLVLTLESGLLVFVYSVSGNSPTPHLISTQVPLIDTGLYLESLGEHLCVDPRSRAMAVAAQEGLVCIYNLKSMDELEKEVQSNTRINPITSQRHFRVDGVITKMEFLYPTADDPSNVTLLLIFSKEGRSRLAWYNWDPTVALQGAHVAVNSQLLPPEESPLLMIPLNVPFSAVLLVYETFFHVYRDLLTGPPKISSRELYIHPDESGLCTRAPMWVQWARVMRYSQPSTTRDDGVYLCRENGFIDFLPIGKGFPMSIRHPVERLPVNVNGAFAFLDMGPQKGDVLAIGGDSSDGGLWCFEAREQSNRLSVQPNWTPIFGSTTIPDSSDGRPLSQPRVFSSGSRGKDGSIFELRYGIPAARSLSLDLGEFIQSGALAVWAVTNATYSTSFVFLSLPKQTLLVSIQPDESGGFGSEVLTEHKDLDLHSRTLAASVTSIGKIIQITEGSIRQSYDLDPELPAAMEVTQHDISHSRVVAACIGTSKLESITLVALGTMNDYRLELGKLDPTYRTLGQPMMLPSIPSSMCLTSNESHTIGLVACADRKLRTYVMAEEENIWQQSGEHQFDGDFAICDSIASCEQVQYNRKYGDVAEATFIACGKRDGSVSLLLLQAAKTKYVISEVDHKNFGSTPANVSLAESEPGKFIVHCGEVLCRLQISESVHKADSAEITRVWITDKENPSWQQGSFSAVTVAKSDSSSGQHGSSADMLFCVDQTSIQIASIDDTQGAQNVPRRIALEGTPSSIIYSAHWKRLIVLSHEVAILRHPRGTGSRKVPGIRAFQPVITFVDPDHGQGYQAVDPIDREDLMAQNPDQEHPYINEQYDAGRVLPDYNAAERFSGITEWRPKTGKNTHNILIVNTIVRPEVKKKAAGRLLIYHVSCQDVFRLAPKKQISHTSPVYAVTVHPTRKLIFYCTGEDVCAVELEEEPNRMAFRTWIKTPLHSPPRRMTVENDRLCISTVDDSFHLFDIGNESLVFCFADTLARQTVDHLFVPEYDLFLVTSIEKSFVGLWAPPQPRIDNALPSVFEAANLPYSVTRLQRLGVPTWYYTEKQSKRAPLPDKANKSYPLTYLGTCTSGELVQIAILNENQWPLLLFIQYLARLSPLIAPFGFAIPRRRVTLAEFMNYTTEVIVTCENTVPMERHIDGDLLARILDRGADDLLHHLISRDYTPARRRPRRRRSSSHPPRGGDDDDDDDMYDDDEDADMEGGGGGDGADGSDNNIDEGENDAANDSEDSDVDGDDRDDMAKFLGTSDERWKCFVELADPALDLWFSDDVDLHEMAREPAGRKLVVELVVRWLRRLCRPLM